MSAALSARLAGLAPPPTDADLLARYAAGRDGAAFAELVRRHGPMVLAVCRRVTAHAHDAEDAFQAAFLVLARKAARLGPDDRVAAWLYGVAVRAARKAAGRAWRGRETLVAAVPDVPERPAEPFDADAATAVIEEVGRLPDFLRAAVVLCELEGRSRTTAARELGVAEGTLSSRLAAARKRLAARLAARGFAPAALAALAGVSVPPALMSATSSFATGAPVPAAVAVLAHGVRRAMFLQHWKFVPVAAGLVASVALAAGLLAAPSAAPPTPPARAAAAQPPAPKAAPLPKSPNRILVYLNGRLTTIDPDGKNPTPVTEAGKNPTPATNPRLSPDGKRVAYLWHDERPRAAGPDDLPQTTPERHLYVQNADGTGPATDLGVAATAFAWSPDSTRVAVTSIRGVLKTVLAEHVVVTVADKTVAPLPLPADHVVTDWSRDGRYFLTQFAVPPADGKGVQLRLALRHADGREHKVLNAAGDGLLNGRLSPDGKRVLCEQYLLPTRPGGTDFTLRLAVLAVETGTHTPLADYPAGAAPRGHSWSPDGRRVTYAWANQPPVGPGAADVPTETHLVVCDADGRNPTTILTARGRSAGTIPLAGPDWR